MTAQTRMTKPCPSYQVHHNACWLACLGLIAATCVLLGPAAGYSQQEIEVANLERDEPVDFQAEVLPILRKNCLACHNATDADGDLVLETVEAMLEGGSEGPAVEPGNSEESLLLLVARHRADPIMPPEDNSVEAQPLTPDELGLVKLWIDQGAPASTGLAASTITFERLPPGMNPVYALAVTPDGQYVAAGRANQVFVYHLPGKREVARLTDTALIEAGIYENPGVAHLDLVQSLQFSPDGNWLATGGYRTAKIWRRSQPQIVGSLEFAHSITSTLSNQDAPWIVIGLANGEVSIVDKASMQVKKSFAAHSSAVTGLAFGKDALVYTCSDDKTVRRWNLNDGTEVGVPLQLGVEATAVLPVVGGEQVAVSLANHKIQLWPTTAFDAPEETGVATDTAEADGEPAAESSQDEETPDPQTEPIQPTHELAGHNNRIHRLELLVPDGTQFVSGSEDGSVRIWSVTEAKMVRQLNHGAPVTDVAVTNDGSKVVSTSRNKTLRIWNAADGKQLHEVKGDLRAQLDAELANRQFTLAQRHVQLATADRDAANQRKQSEEENQKKAEEAHKTATEQQQQKKQAADAAIAAKQQADQELAAAMERKTKAEQNATAMTEAFAKADERHKEMQGQLKTAQDAVNQSTNQLKQQLTELQRITTLVDKDLQNADLLNQLKTLSEQVDQLTAKQLEAVNKFNTVDADAKAAMTARVEAEQAKQAADKELNDANAAIKPAQDKVNSLAGPMQKATDELTVAQRNLDSAIRTLDRAKLSVEKATAVVPEMEAALAAAQQAQASADERKNQANAAVGAAEQPLQATWIDSQQGVVFATNETGDLLAWDLETGAPHKGIDVAEAACQDGRLIGDNRSCLTQDKKLMFVDLGGEWSLHSTIGDPDGESPLADRVTAMDFSPDGRLLALGSGEPSRSGSILIWNIEAQKLEREIADPHSDSVWCLRFSPDGTRLASSAADRFVKLFDVSTGELIRAFEGHTHHVLGVAWSADGRSLASSGADKTVKIWDALTGDQKRSIPGFGKEATGIQWLGQTDQVLVSCGDASVTLKRSSNGSNVRGFGGFGDFVYCVAATEDGRYILAGGQDSVIRVWDPNGQLFTEFKAPE